MNMTQDKRRRDWSIIILMLPLGVAMMMCVGQQAIRMSPNWSVSGDMNSLLDPESAPRQNALVVPPISSDILTPVTWWETFLTPSNENDTVVVFPPFITFEPSASPTVTASPTGSTTPSPTATSLTATPTPTTPTPTKKPDDSTPTPPTTCQNPSASNFGGPLPCVFPPTTCTDPLATNNGGPLPCTYPPTTCTDPLATNNGGPLPCVYPPTTCTDPLANNNGGPLPCIYPVTSTPVGAVTAVPGGYNYGTPSGGAAVIPDGYYVVINLPTPIVVNGPSDTNYDFVYYELAASPGVNMDRVILSISKNNIDYYVVFNWGDGIPDTNSNVGDVAGAEDDNQPINSSELHGTAPQDTGILVDVDNAPSNPPTGNYNYLAIQVPTPAPAAVPPNNGTDGADVNSVEVIEVAP
jgi:hypothetical protein